MKLFSTKKDYAHILVLKNEVLRIKFDKSKENQSFIAMSLIVIINDVVIFKSF